MVTACTVAPVIAVDCYSSANFCEAPLIASGDMDGNVSFWDVPSGVQVNASDASDSTPQ